MIFDGVGRQDRDPFTRTEAKPMSNGFEHPELLLERGARQLSKIAGNGGQMLFDHKGYLIKADACAALTVAAIGIKLNGKPPLRINALDISVPKAAANVKLPDWLKSEWVEPVIEVGHRLGTIVVLPERLQQSVSLPARGLPRYKLRRVLEFIDVHIDQPIRLEQLALAAGVSRFYFHRQFKGCTGLTPREYILQKRIERAKALLSQSDLPLADVAAQVGFADQSHFTTTFRMATSMTPRSYRMATSVELMAIKVYVPGQARGALRENVAASGQKRVVAVESDCVV